RALAEGTRDRLSRILGTPFGGAEPAAIVMSEMHAVGFDLGPSARTAVAALNPDDAISSYRITIDPAHIPVRKSIADWLLFRKIASVRRRLFGEDLSNDIAAEVKKKRLPDASRTALDQAMTDAIKPTFSTLPGKYGEGL